MITLYGFGPAFGLPDPSPFVIKVEVLLKMAGLEFRSDANGFRKAPKRKLPYINDDGALVADSTFIRWHIEEKYGFDFDRALTAEQRAIAWAFEKMAEEHLYWAMVHARWMDDANFDKGPRKFFESVTPALRPAVVAFIRYKVRSALWAQGMGRHKPAEIERLGIRSIDAIADYLGGKPFFMGTAPSAVDATIFAFLCGTMCPPFETPIRTAAGRHDNLRRYVGRMIARYYPDYEEMAGCRAAA
jgi:glutathione S-transferase